MVAIFKTLCGCERVMKIAAASPPTHYRLPIITPKMVEMRAAPELIANLPYRHREFRLTNYVLATDTAEYTERE